ncbi:MAG: hypothetical protein RQ746_14175 [Bacteroidales bacterium]|nr:hypothetical protein [Bacteroidales bacterium]
MESRSKKSTLVFVFVLFSIGINQSCSESRKNIDDYDINIVTSWNEKILKLAVAEDKLLTLKGVRTASKMHTAMHDALNSIIPKYTRYAYEGKIVQANPATAVANAA